MNVHEAICFDGFQTRLIFYDDFEGDQLKDEWREIGDAGGSVAVVDSETGGVIRISSDGDDLDDWAIDWGLIRTLLVSKRVAYEARVKLGDTTDLQAEVGFRRDGTEFIFFGANTSADQNWHLYAYVAPGITNEDTGIALDTSYHIFRIECHIHGSPHVHYYIDGVECTGSPISDDVSTRYLQAWLWIRTRAASVQTMDVDYVYIRQDR